MTAGFFTGIGAQNRTFGSDSSVSQAMAQSGPVQDVLNHYYVTGETHDLYSSRAPGYVAAGASPVGQFVGSFRWSISPANGDINLTLRNTTSFKSLTYDKGPQWQRRTTYPGAGIRMGDTRQIYKISYHAVDDEEPASAVSDNGMLRTSRLQLQSATRNSRSRCRYLRVQIRGSGGSSTSQNLARLVLESDGKYDFVRGGSTKAKI